MIIRFLSIADKELSDIFQYYEETRTGLGKIFFKQINFCIKRISKFPFSHKLISKNIRKAYLNRFPYYILYFVEESEIIVIAIAHTSRNPNYWIERL